MSAADGIARLCSKGHDLNETSVRARKMDVCSKCVEALLTTHGHVNSYARGCRCGGCMGAHRNYMRGYSREWKRRKRAGLPTRNRTIKATVTENVWAPRKSMPAFVTSVEIWLEDQRKKREAEARARFEVRR